MRRHRRRPDPKAMKRTGPSRITLAKKFKVIRVPIGEAPEDVRQAWVGVVLDLFRLGKGGEIGVVSGKILPDREVVVTPKADALKALADKDPTAAEWYYNLYDTTAPTGVLCFGLAEVELI